MRKKIVKNLNYSIVVLIHRVLEYLRNYKHMEHKIYK